jgi:hypothetical protein
MVERTAVRAADRAARLMRSAMLLAGLAAILFVSYGLVAPLPFGLSYWRLPIGIATAGGLVLLVAWPSRREGERTRTADDLAAMLGLASMILGTGAAMLVASGVALNIAENRHTTQAFLYQMTHPAVVVSLLVIAAPPATFGVLGLAIARRRGRAAGRVSAAGVASRFSAIGLACAGVIVAFASAVAIYRWVTWG